MVTLLPPLSERDSIELLSEYLDIDLADIQKISLDRREAARMQKIAEQIAKDQAEEVARAERRRIAFMQMWTDGKIILRVDGTHKHKPSPICKEGTPDMAKIIWLVSEARTKLFQHGKVLDNVGNILPAATISQDVTCSCGQTHRVEIFVTNTK